MRNKKDVLFLCQFFYPEYVSSATLPFDTAHALAKAGMSVDVLCGYPKEYSQESKTPKNEMYEGIGIKRLNYLQLKRSNFLGRLVNYFSFTLAVAFHFGKLRKYKSIIVYSNPPILPIISAFASICFKVKLIFVCYDVYPEIAYRTNSISESGIISKSMKFINKMVFTRASKVIALSNEMKKYLVKQRPIQETQVEVIPNWYEDKKPLANNPNPLNNKLFSSFKARGDIVVSYFGNMGICQDLTTIIGAIQELKDNKSIKFLFAGHGSKMQGLKDIVESEKLHNVKIFDFLHGQDFQDALAISDCFLVSLEEGLNGLCVPSKTYSYMMAGKPVIAIMDDDCDIVRELNENNAGFSVQIGESHILAQAITNLSENVTRGETMGLNCRQVFLEKYTTNYNTQKYVNMVRKVLEVEKYV